MSTPIDTIIDPLQKREPDEQILTESGFYWRERNGVKALVCGTLEKAGFANAFSTRIGGVSPFPENDLNLAGFDEDTSENIAENRERFLSLFEGEYTLTTVWQVHGDDIKVVAGMDDAANTEDRADALASDLPGLLVSVKTADCVPILIGDPRTDAYSAAHAGWRGTAESIAAKTVAKMVEAFGSRPEDMIVAIGPAACGRNYEVGQDVIDAFANNFSARGKYFTRTREGHALVDLHAANRDQLIASSIPAENIFTAPFCTMERTDLFFSYRIEKRLHGRTGRLMSVIGQG